MTVGRKRRTEDDKRFDAEVGRLIRAARWSAGLTQAQVAAQSGISRNAVTLAESGTMGLTVRLLARIAAAIGVSPGSLLPGHEEEEPSPDWIDAVASL